MLQSNVLDAIKLVEIENFANEIETEFAIEAAIQQGSQKWGVTRDVSVLLSITLQLRTALEEAATADRNARMLKGAQLELGRTKKALTTALDRIEAANSLYELAQEKIGSLQASVGDLNVELLQLKAQKADLLDSEHADQVFEDEGGS